MAVSFYVLPECITLSWGAMGKVLQPLGTEPLGGRDPYWGGRLGARGRGDPRRACERGRSL